MGIGYLPYLKGLGFSLERTKKNVWVTDWPTMIAQMVFAEKIVILRMVKHYEVPTGRGQLLTNLTPKLLKMLKPKAIRATSGLK